MSNYVRGQETFTQKVNSSIRNFIGLMFFSVSITAIFFCILIYARVPSSIWFAEKFFLKEMVAYLKRSGPIHLPNAIDIFTQLSRKNFSGSQQIFFETIYWSVSLGILVFIALFVFFIVRGRAIRDSDYRRGSVLISPKEFNREYRQLIRNEINEIRKDNKKSRGSDAPSFAKFWGIPFICSAHNIQIPSFVLYRHCAMIGTTGVGKSTLIKWYLEYCRENGEKVIIPDINGEYAAEFFREGDTILSLFDVNTVYWDFKSENIDPTEFAKFLVPSGDEHGKFWWKGARQVVSQLLEAFKNPEDLWETLNNEKSDISDNLSGLARKIAGKEGTSQAAGITGTSLLDFGFLRFLNKWPESKGNKTPFSIFDWTQNNSSSWIFITFSDSDKEIINPLFKLWINTAITGLLKRTTCDIPLNIIIDELATLGKIELLPTALERGRKYGGKVVLGYQSENQLLDIYGKDSAGSIKANTGSKFIFRCPEPHEAKELSDFLGRQEVIEKNLGTSYGAKNSNDRENISERESLRNVVLDSEIRDLPDGHFYLKSLSINPTRSRIKKKKWQRWYEIDLKTPPQNLSKSDPITEDLPDSSERKLMFSEFTSENSPI